MASKDAADAKLTELESINKDEFRQRCTSQQFLLRRSVHFKSMNLLETETIYIYIYIWHIYMYVHIYIYIYILISL